MKKFKTLFVPKVDYTGVASHKDGYYCRKSFSSGGPTPPNGVCWYITNCSTAGCPAGLECVEVTGPGIRPFSRCARP